MTSLDYVDDFIGNIARELRFLEQPGYYDDSEGFTKLYRRAKFASGRLKDINEHIARIKADAELAEKNRVLNPKQTKRALRICKQYEKTRTRLQKVEQTLEQRSFLERKKEKEAILMSAKRESELRIKRRAERELDYQRIKHIKRKRQVAKRAMEKEIERQDEEEKSRLYQVLRLGNTANVENARSRSSKVNWTPSTNVFNRQSLRKLSESQSISKLYQYMVRNNPHGKCIKVTEIFLTLLMQIVEKPNNERIRILRAGNTRFQESVVKVDGSLACLLKIGFMDVVCEQTALICNGSSDALTGGGTRKELWYVMKVPSPIDDSYGWSNWMEDIQQNIVFFKQMLAELKSEYKQRKSKSLRNS